MRKALGNLPPPLILQMGKLRPRAGQGLQGHTAKWGSAGRLGAKRGTLNQAFGLISGGDLGSGRLQELQLQASVQGILGTRSHLPDWSSGSGCARQPGQLGCGLGGAHSEKGF